MIKQPIDSPGDTLVRVYRALWKMFEVFSCIWDKLVCFINPYFPNHYPMSFFFVFSEDPLDERWSCGECSVIRISREHPQRLNFR